METTIPWDEAEDDRAGRDGEVAVALTPDEEAYLASEPGAPAEAAAYPDTEAGATYEATGYPDPEAGATYEAVVYPDTEAGATYEATAYPDTESGVTYEAAAYPDTEAGMPGEAVDPDTEAGMPYEAALPDPEPGMPGEAERRDGDSRLPAATDPLAAMEEGVVGLRDFEEEGQGRAVAPGVSPVAVPAAKQWDAGDRPKEWQGRVFGLVVHTTGSGLPAKARANGVYHTIEAVAHYNRSHGCHYINGWRGVAGGDLLQVANEREQAAGVGVTNKDDPRKDQRRSIDAGRFEADLPPVLVRLWRVRWPGRRHSLELLPGTRTANSCYVHVECVPCVYAYQKRWVTDAEPLRSGLRFTQAQHDAVALLACDVARRNGWPPGERWWRTPRLLGHEDLTPISRYDRRGGWDPGGLREAPYFDWEYVYSAIERIQAGGPGAPSLPPVSRAGPSILAALGSVVDRFRTLLMNGQEQLAVRLAYERGVREPNALTNLVFFARHPEMDGRKIRPDETRLASEWLDVRDRLVVPALRDLGRR